ncbi:MAG: PEGA domain-containing protein [Bradymonadia bacterium]
MLRTSIICLILAALPTESFADKVVCPPVRVGAGISDAIRAKFDDAVRKAVARTRKVVGRDSTAAAMGTAKITADKCTGPECGAALTQAAKARFAVMSSVISEDEIYKVTVVVYDAAQGKVGAPKVETCELCAVGEVASITIPKAVKGLADQLKAPAPKKAPADAPMDVQVQSTPPGADVYVAEVFQGKTPLTVKLKPGDHVLKLSKAGFEPEDRPVTVKADAKGPITVKIPLKVVAEPTTALTRTERTIERTDSYAQYGWGSIIGGALLVGGGIWLIDLDGDITCDDGRGRTECPNVYDTRWAGAGALGIGAAALGVGISLLVLDPGGVPTEPTPSVSPTPSGQGAMFNWSGRW